MSRKRKVPGGVLVLALIAIAFVYAQIDIAASSIQFDLRKNGQWPARIEDLDGTAYPALPHRRA